MLFSWHSSLWDFSFLGVLGCSWNSVAATLTSCQREPANPRILISKPVFGAGKLQTDIDPNWASHRNSWLLHLDIHLRHAACPHQPMLHYIQISHQLRDNILSGTILSGTIKLYWYYVRCAPGPPVWRKWFQCLTLNWIHLTKRNGTWLYLQRFSLLHYGLLELNCALVLWCAMPWSVKKGNKSCRSLYAKMDWCQATRTPMISMWVWICRPCPSGACSLMWNHHIKPSTCVME